MYNINFYEAMSELDNIYNKVPKNSQIINTQKRIIEELPAIDGAQKNDLENLVNKIKETGSVTINKNDYPDIIDAAKKVTVNFHGNPEHKWAYQLQLLCNAYISEKAVLYELTRQGSPLMQLVRKYAKTTTFKKALIADLDDTYTETADFNGVHTEIWLPPNKSKPADGNHDITVQFSKSKNGDINSTEFLPEVNKINVEVKAAQDKPVYKGSAHRAHVIFIIVMKDKNVYCKVKTNRGKYQYCDADGSPTQDGQATPVYTFNDLKFISTQVDAATFSLDSADSDTEPQ